MSEETVPRPVEGPVGRQCQQEVMEGPFGVRKCAFRAVDGDTLCKRHRALAERSGYEDSRVLTPNA